MTAETQPSSPSTTPIELDESWPEDVPSVAVDASLGQQMEMLDLDPMGIEMLLDSERVEPSDRDRLSILIVDRLTYKRSLIEKASKLVTGWDHAGDYNPRKKQIRIFLDANTDVERANDSLSHELHHFGQDMRGELSYMDAYTRGLTTELRAIGGLIMGQSPRRLVNEDYRQNPIEVSARKAADNAFYKEGWWPGGVPLYFTRRS